MFSADKVDWIPQDDVDRISEEQDNQKDFYSDFESAVQAADDFFSTYPPAEAIEIILASLGPGTESEAG
jgi:hypothetical protein